MDLNFNDYDAIAFDFDGTLADTYHHHEETRFDVFTESGYDLTMDDHRLGHTYGNTTNDIISGLLKAAGKIPQDADSSTHPEVRRLAQRKNELYKQLAMAGFDAKPGAVEFVKAAAKQYGEHICIVTAAMYIEVEAFLIKYQLTDLFPRDRIICEETISDHAIDPKPSPDSYLLALKQFKISEPQRLLVFEDSLGGVQSAKAAETTVVALGGSVTDEEFYDAKRPFKPDFFVETFNDIRLRS